MHMHMHMHMHMDGLSSSCLVVIAHAHVCETLAQTRTCARCDVPIGRRGKLDQRSATLQRGTGPRTRHSGNWHIETHSDSKLCICSTCREDAVVVGV